MKDNYFEKNFGKKGATLMKIEKKYNVNKNGA